MNLFKLPNKNQLDYVTKIDGFYYDKKTKTTKIILKVRNKRAVSGISINDLLKEKESLSNLSPIDLCIIGILSNNLASKKQKINKDYVSISDEFLTQKINPFLKIVGRDFNGKEEILKIKIHVLEKIISISALDLFRNKRILAALQYQDALALGFSLSNPDFKNNISRKEKFNINSCLHIGIFLSAFFLSILLSTSIISLGIYESIFKIKGEIVMLPLLVPYLIEIIRNFNQKEANNIVFCSLLILIVFISYYFFITKLPFLADDKKTIAFNTLYENIIKKSTLLFIVSIICTSLIFIYTRKIKVQLCKPDFNRIIFYHIYLFLFFLIYRFISPIDYHLDLFITSALYCSISIIIITILTKMIRNKFVSSMIQIP